MFCRAMLCKRGNWRHAVSVSPSVCLPRSWILSKRINISLKKISQPGSQTILVFPCIPDVMEISGLFRRRPAPSNGGVECRWCRHKSRFWTNRSMTAGCASNCDGRPCSLLHRRRRISESSFITACNKQDHVVISAWRCRIIPSNLVQIVSSIPELLTFSRNSRWRRPPSWTFKLCEFSTFHHVSSEVPELCTKYGSNICHNVSEIDALLVPTSIWWRHAN